MKRWSWLQTRFVGPRELGEMLSVPVLGVILPGARRAVEQSRTGRIGVIGTRATIDSSAYARAIQALRADAQVTSRACPLFVPLAEEGWTASGDDIARRIAARYLEPFGGRTWYVLVLWRTIIPAEGGDRRRSWDPRAAGRSAVRRGEVRSARNGSAAGSSASSPSRASSFLCDDVPGRSGSAERFLGRPMNGSAQASLNPG